MNKIIKISSNQGGSFSATNNLVDFDIPADGVYDLSKSYVNLMMSISETPTTPAKNGVYIPQVNFRNGIGTPLEIDFTNIAMVKNFSMTCANKGQIADVRRVDVLRDNLNEYMLNTDERESLGIKTLFNSYGTENQIGSIFREIRREGNDNSLRKQSPVKIPLSQLCNFGKVQQYSTEKYGRTRLHLELNIDRLIVSQYLGNNDAGNQWSRGDARNSFQGLTATMGSDGLTLFSENKFKDLTDSPFYVNQVIRLTTAVANQANGETALVNTARRIVSILFRRDEEATDGTDGQIELTLDEDILGGNTDGNGLRGATTITISAVDGDACLFTPNVDYGELVLEKVMSPQPQKGEIQYTEFSTEEHNANSAQFFQRQFQVEPSCINLFIMMNKNDEIKSRRGGVLNWRLRLNNEDLTDRKVVYRSPLSHDRINMTLGNSDNKLHNAKETCKSLPSANSAGVDVITAYDALVNDTVLICNPLPQTPNEKMVQVNINMNATNLNQFVLFKECVRTI